MNYNVVESINPPTQRNSVYMLIKPDAGLSQEQDLESYMDMSPVNHLDMNEMLHVARTEKPDPTEKVSGYADLQFSSDRDINFNHNKYAGAEEHEQTAYQRQSSAQSSGSEAEKQSNASPTSPEKRANKLKGFRKQMTMNWKPAKTLASPKKRYVSKHLALHSLALHSLALPCIPLPCLALTV